MREIDHAAIDRGELLGRFLKSPEGHIISEIIDKRRAGLAEDLLCIGRNMIPHGYAEFYAHRIAALDELVEEIHGIVETGARERSHLVLQESATPKEPADVRPEKATEEQ